jgi:hypothetical protein
MTLKMSNIKVPPVSPGYPVGKPQYRSGAVRSVSRLKNLGFDPIGELVERYRALETDINNYRKIRSGELIEYLNNGKPRAFSYEVLLMMEDKLIQIADKLLRYGYGRVPESGIQEAVKRPTLEINLHKDGQTFQIAANVVQEEEFEYIDNESDD